MKNNNFHTFFSLSWLQILNLPALLENKNTPIGPFLWKQSILQNPDRERTNQSTGICLGLGLPYNNIDYYMANPVLGKSMCFDWFFLGQDFAVWTVSMETVQPVYFCFGAKPANSKFATKTAEKNCVECYMYNKQLANRPCSGRTG